jgi:hypothetical protein
MTHAKSIKPMKILRTKHVAGLAGSWLSRFAECFWIKNGTRVGVCSLSFAAETMCFGGPGQPLYVHRVGAMAAAATVFNSTVVIVFLTFFSVVSLGFSGVSEGFLRGFSAAFLNSNNHRKL